MKLTLRSLSIENFKGIKNKTIHFTNRTTISGDNATGKTTIFDAYSWLLWDKDSLNRKVFNIKPFNTDGENIHGVESIVKGVLLVDDQELTLEKIYREVWAKKKGSTKETFTGNTTDYFINEVPVTKSEYNERVATLVNEKEFNLLSNPLYFNAILDKKERRDVLLSLINNIDHRTIIDQNKALEKLDLDHYSVEEIKAMAKASSRKINKEIESLPTRIDELEKSKNQFDFDCLERTKKQVEKDIHDIDAALVESNKLTSVVKMKNDEIQALFTKKNTIKHDVDERNYKHKRQVEEDYRRKKDAFDDEKRKLTRELQSIEFKQDGCQDEIDGIRNKIFILEKDTEELRKRWVEKNKEEFDGSLNCPTCGRAYEEGKKDEIIARFNTNKSRCLSDIEEDAEATKFNLKNLKKILVEKEKESLDLKDCIRNLEDELNKLGEFQEDMDQVVQEEYPAEYYEIDQEVSEIEKELEAISMGDNTDLIRNKNRLQAELNQVISDLALKNQNKELDERIEQYKQEEKELASKYEEQQEILFLCDEYIRTYTSLIQDHINDLFRFVSFRLFEKQVNGDLKETAEVTVNGVPYGDVNNAGKLNAGLDVINTLSKKMGVKVPIFVDNAESVNDLLEVDSQIVRLVVSKEKVLQIKGE